jgi:hypothetical protein
MLDGVVLARRKLLMRLPDSERGLHRASPDAYFATNHPYALSPRHFRIFEMRAYKGSKVS